MGKKIVFAFDGRRQPDPYHGRDDIAGLIRQSEKYGYEVVCTYDDVCFARAEITVLWRAELKKKDRTGLFIQRNI